MFNSPAINDAHPNLIEFQGLAIAVAHPLWLAAETMVFPRFLVQPVRFTPIKPTDPVPARRPGG